MTFYSVNISRKCYKICFFQRCVFLISSMFDLKVVVIVDHSFTFMVDYFAICSVNKILK